MEFVFDRTYADVLEAKANKASTTPQKGALNYQDLNRIEGNAQQLIELLKIHGYYYNLDLKTDWTMQDLPTLEQINRIRDNIFTLQRSVFAYTNEYEKKDTLDYEEVNDWEEWEYLLNKFIPQIAAEFRYCGELTCGE